MAHDLVLENCHRLAAFVARLWGRHNLQTPAAVHARCRQRSAA